MLEENLLNDAFLEDSENISTNNNTEQQHQRGSSPSLEDFELKSFSLSDEDEDLNDEEKLVKSLSSDYSILSQQQNYNESDGDSILDWLEEQVLDDLNNNDNSFEFFKVLTTASVNNLEEGATNNGQKTGAAPKLLLASDLSQIQEVEDEGAKSETSILNNLSEIFEKYQAGAQEPWPKDVKLYQPYEVEQILLPDNANCLAVQAFLKMCQLDFQIECRANAEAMSPSGKVPFIKCGAFVISELEPIVQFINGKGITLTEKLDQEMKSDMRAYMSLVHNVMEIAELYICWVDKETYNEVTSVRHGSVYPWPLNHIQNRAKRNAVLKKLKVLGWLQKYLGEVFQEVENCCQALTDRLEGKEFFFGDKPTELDALVFGHLFTILTTPLPNSYIANTVRNYPVLINLVQRIEKDYFKRETRH